MFRAMVLKRAWDMVGGLQNAIKKRSAENSKRIIDSCNGNDMRFILIQ